MTKPMALEDAVRQLRSPTVPHEHKRDTEAVETLLVHAERTVSARSVDALGTLRAVVESDPYHQQFRPLVQRIDALTAELDAARTQCDELAQVVQRVRAVTVHEDEPYSGCGDMYCPGGMSETYMLADDVRAALGPVSNHHNQRSA
jgi:hypothetical protein